MKPLFTAIFIFCFTLLWKPSLANQSYTVEDFNTAYGAYSDAADKAHSFAEHKAIIPLAQKVLDIGVGLSIQPRDLAVLYTNLAWEQYNGGKRSDANLTIDSATELIETTLGKQNSALIDILLLKGKIVSSLGDGRTGAASRYFKRALKISETTYGKTNNRHAQTLLSIADYWMLRGDRGKIHSHLIKAIRILEDADDTQSVLYGSALFRLGKVELAKGREKKSIEYLNKAIGSLEEELDPTHPAALSAHQFLVQAYEKVGMKEEADKHCRHIANVDQETGEGEPVVIYRTMMQYPASAMFAGQEGWVVVNFTIDDRGNVKDAEVIDGKRQKTSTKSALEALEQWRFRPGYVDGKFVERTDQRIRMVYELAD